MFHNLDDISVQKIRQVSQRASQPIEKAVLYRMMRLAIHGIQVVLVVDGLGRPPKKNKITTKGYSFITENLALLKSTAEVLGIPWWQAPGEAEAECAQMQRLGLVDAVWSEDSDTFLFKGTAMLRFHIEADGSKSNTHARLHQMDKIAEKAKGMDWRDLVLFAIIVGGDYDPKGLVQCGPKLALEAIRQGHGLKLAKAFENGDMTAWRQKFKQFLENQGNHVLPPIGFPSTDLLRNYIKPKVSSELELRSGFSWDSQVDNAALRNIITSRYNFSVQENISWVVRMLLARRLLLRDRLDELAMEFMRSVSSKESGNIPMSKVSFLLPAIMPRHLLESWPVKITKAASRIRTYEHVDRIECDIPDSITKLALPGIQDLQKLPNSTISAKVSVQPTGQGHMQAEVGKRKRGRPRKYANNAVTTSTPLKDTGHGKSEEKQAGRKSSGLERSIGRHFETAPSERTFFVSPYLQRSEAPLLSQQAEHSHGDLSDEDFPDISELGQQRRTKYAKTTQPLDKSTSNDLADITLQNNDHRHCSAFDSENVAGNASLHDTVTTTGQFWETPRFSSNMAASAEKVSNPSSRVGRSLSQTIDLTGD